jgi:hypothetical protein
VISVATTVAPSATIARTVARPMPCAADVTTADFPANRPVIINSSVWKSFGRKLL